MPKPATRYGIGLHRTPKRQNVGSQFLATQKHFAREVWYKRQYFSTRPFAISKHMGGTPRILLDRSLWRSLWFAKANLPDVNRWEKVVNSQRVTEDRWALVEEEGTMYQVNWKMYGERLEAELQKAQDQLPQYSFMMKAVPSAWKKLDIELSVLRGLSVREAMAQCKLSTRKGHMAVFRALELTQQGAEGKGLDKERLRIASISCAPGPTDKQVDLRSRGYYAWKTKKSSHLLLTVCEDPEMVLPDRTAIPYASLMTMKRAGLRTEPTVLDVPAITAEGI
ncbi:Ribosomal protein L22p/L17e [Novymonas esmeraldas]|uniref:Ribosomal protein L22p/L17e n=1 Tax=Novymonas esmeraldas TaxID=1808958 RepID=A0AAW0EQ90_9TRYP